MALYDPRLLSAPQSFEVLVCLVLQEEDPEADVERLLPPDWGIDILVRSRSGTTAYQCKHYPSPRISTVRREVKASLEAACLHRDIVRWKRIVFCFSSDLTAPQSEAVREIARSFGLKHREFGIRAGTSFLRTLSAKPGIWDIATALPNQPESTSASEDGGFSISDSRLRRVFARARAIGRRRYISDLLADAGISRIGTLRDWYEIALPFFGGTRRILRLMTFDNEISLFWLTKRGGPYLRMNVELAQRGVDVRRIFVIDFDMQKSNPLALYTFLAYCEKQESIGINCRIIPSDVFEAETPLECQIFCVQDSNNIMLYAPLDLSVVFVKDRSLISDASDVYDSLFHHREAKLPSEISSAMASNPGLPTDA